MADKFYITTAIAYPNGRPHMGHALEIVQVHNIYNHSNILRNHLNLKAVDF